MTQAPLGLTAMLALLKPRNFLAFLHTPAMAAAHDADAARLREWFHRALDLGGAAREAFLDEVCGGDEATRRRLLALIKAHEGAGDFLLDPTAGGAAEDIVGVKSGDRLGPYRLLEEIGHGGFGIVFRAEQREPVRRMVAIKVLKPGMDTRQVIARFEAERQALALMDHPHIARVLEAGATANGRPFFAMEFVEGEPITDFCDRHRLEVTARLRLFLDVCHGVQHAHQKGVIHRDLKPSNILVAENDGRAVPKVIDFGVAKATGPSLTDKTLVTQLAELVGTPAYISPEQIELSVLGVDTRADIFSLGVMLYELLTGTTPVDARTLSGRSLLDLRQLILEYEAPRPSTRVGLRAPEEAKYRTTHGVEASALRARVTGDLDWITMKAIEKDRTRRYSTVEELARDLERHLRDEPVEAGPPSTWYWLGKFVRRHRAGVGAAAVAVVALTMGFGVAISALIQAKHNEAAARQQGGRAREVISLLKGVFESVDPTVKGEGYTVRQLLDDYSREFPLGLAADPAAESELRLTMGRAYRALGEYQRADPQLRRVLEIAGQLHGPDSPEAARARREFGVLRLAQENPTDASRELSGALTIFERTCGPSHPDTLAAKAELGEAELALKKLDSAQEQAGAVLKRLGSPVPSAARATELMARSTLAEVQFRRGDVGAGLQNAEATATEALKELGARHPTTRLAANRLAALKSEQEQNPGAQQSFEDQLRQLITQLGVAHPDTLRQTIVQLQGLIRSGQHEEARRRMREVIALVQQVGGLAVGDPKAPLPKLTDYVARSGRLSDFEAFIGDGVGLARELFKPGDPELSWLLRVAALLHFHRHDLPESGRLFREALAACTAQGRAGRTTAAESACFLRDTLGRAHRAAEAAAVLSPEPPSGVAPVEWAGVLHEAAILRIGQKRWQEAIDLLDQALELRRRLLGTSLETLETLEILREQHLGGRRVAALPLAREAVAMATSLLGERDARTLTCRHAELEARKFGSCPELVDELSALHELAVAALPADHVRIERIAAALKGARLEATRRAERRAAAATAWEKASATSGPDSREAFLARETMVSVAVSNEGGPGAFDDLLALRSKAAAFFQPTDPWFARYISGLGWTSGWFHRDKEAEEYYRTGLDLWARAGGIDHPDAQRAVQDACFFHRIRGDNGRFWQVLDSFEDRQRQCLWEPSRTTVLVPRASWWSYWTAPASLSTDWRQPGFDDHRWMAASGWFTRVRQYSGNALLAWPPGAPATGTACFRTVFDVSESARWRQLKVRLSCDDAGAIFLNGQALVRYRLPPETTLSATVTAPRKRSLMVYYPMVFLMDPAALRAGRNVLAAEIHEVPGGENDFFFELQLEGLSR